MPVYSKKEFAAICGITTKTLSTYVLRGKVKYSGDYVDDTIPLNKVFLEEKQSQNAHRILSEDIKGVTKTLMVTRPLNKEEIKSEGEKLVDDYVFKNQKPDTHLDESDLEEDDGGGANLSKMLLQKKQLEIDKLKEEVKKLNLGNNKTQGDFVSIDLVKNLIVLHSESLKDSYENGLQEFIVKFSGLNQLSREEIFKMKEEVVNLINFTMERSIEETKKALRRIQTDLANKRGVGERL